MRISDWSSDVCSSDLRGLLQQDRRGRRLGDESEGAILIRGDHARNRKARLQLLRGGVERLAELHDVQAALAQRRTDGRAGIGLPGLDLQLDVTDDFLCHCCRSEEHTSELQSLMRISYAVFCLKKKIEEHD